jgi:hypothetical protein
MTSEHDFPDNRPVFEARRQRHPEWSNVWEVWDIEHPAGAGNHYPVLTVDSRGAADDLHEHYAEICADALNRRYAAQWNRYRRDEAEQEREHHHEG